MAATTTPTGAVTTTEGATTSVADQDDRHGTAELFDAVRDVPVSTELTEGPYYFDVDSIRSDITRGPRRHAAAPRAPRPRRGALRADRERHRGHLALRRRPASTPASSRLHRAARAAAAGRPTTRPTCAAPRSTNSDGIVEFKTIYPGWYRGRTVHIHLKVHLDRRRVLTSQLFTNSEFDEQVYAEEPYASDSGRDVYNESDGIYEDGLELTLSEEGDGVLGVMTLDVQRG